MASGRSAVRSRIAPRNFKISLKICVYLYIIKRKVTNKYYVGQTNNIVKRIAYHNNGYCKSTKSGKPWELVYFEEFKTRKEVIKRKIHIKKMKNRKFIVDLIEGRASL